MKKSLVVKGLDYHFSDSLLVAYENVNHNRWYRLTRFWSRNFIHPDNRVRSGPLGISSDKYWSTISISFSESGNEPFRTSFQLRAGELKTLSVMTKEWSTTGTPIQRILITNTSHREVSKMLEEVKTNFQKWNYKINFREATRIYRIDAKAIFINEFTCCY